MKRKLLSVAMAVVMSAVCLAGCSGGWSRSAFISAAKKYGLKELDGDKTLREVLLDEEVCFHKRSKEVWLERA